MSVKATKDTVAAKYGADFVQCLGKKLDSAVAEIWNMPIGTVRSIRKSLGIPTYRKADPEGAARDTLIKRYGVEFVQQLGTLSDRELGSKYGISSSAICRMRSRLNEQPMTEAHPENSIRSSDRVVVFFPKGIFQYSQNDAMEMFLAAWNKARDSKRAEEYGANEHGHTGD